ncbi:KaiC domain-containing protein [Natronomonas sp.]|uniref:KaiC domain-containing protein n=1 Tax=Natronomonas sp. TaxID=2184060 RepID=UPI002616AB39|nr:KaiC domain-containing protein [Natronomonas sp.]
MSDDDWFESGSDSPNREARDDDWFEGDEPSEEPADEEATPGPEESPFGGGGGGGEPSMDDFEAAFDAGTSAGGGGGEPSVDDFEAAFDTGTSAGGGGGDPAGDDEGFDEEFESDIPRLDLGITGLDEMIQGGVPKRSLMVAMGSAGTGKTTFGLQFLQYGIANGERGIYITLEETESAIRQAAVEKGWPFDEYIEDDRLAIVDLDPVEMANSLRSIGNDLPRLIERFDADRLVLDSVSLLEMMYDSPSRRRTEVFEFARSLKQVGVTAMVTSEASDEDDYTSKYGIIEYLTDAVFVLQYVRSEFQETRLAVEIQKIRNANHSRETKPYEITGEGISVYRQASIF